MQESTPNRKAIRGGFCSLFVFISIISNIRILVSYILQPYFFEIILRL
jgi:hypothetical protein